MERVKRVNANYLVLAAPVAEINAEFNHLSSKWAEDGCRGWESRPRNRDNEAANAPVAVMSKLSAAQSKLYLGTCQEGKGSSAFSVDATEYST
jgi:hypothetical protein